MRKIDFSKFCEWEATQVEVFEDSLARYVIDMKKDYPPINFLLKHNGIGCVPQGDLQAMTGKHKAGKTFACICIEIAMLKGEYMGFEALKDGIKILHVDTEQSPGNIVNKASIVHAVCGWPVKSNNDRFKILMLRECPLKERLDKIIEAIERFTPDFVFIDGVRDLSADFNDIGESYSLIGSLMMSCNRHNIGIMCVLHENKNDINMRGHLGTELTNKCSEVFKVSKDSLEKISVEQTVCRNEPIEKWSFSIGNNGVPQSETESHNNKTILRRDEILRAIFNRKKSNTRTELITEFMPMYGCKKRHANTLIGNALKESVLYRQNKLYYFVFPPADDELLL